MNLVLKVFLSMSFSGALLILALLCCKRLLKDKISRQWQYYIWLVVILRLLLPFGPEINLMGKLYQSVDQIIIRAAPISEVQSALNAPGDVIAPAASFNSDTQNANSPTEKSTAEHPFQDIVTLLMNHMWLIWLAAALGMLIRKATIYQSFLRYISAGLTPVSDLGILDRLSAATERAGVKKSVELCVNPLISSPMLIGFFHPCIVLPSVEIPAEDFQYIVLHELTHYKRLDIFYKWLVQITVCLHWFNPLVYLMEREITKACEFSCDEAVLAKIGCDNRQDYGKTLLDAMAAVGKYTESPGAVTLSENKQLLKERLGAIMNFKKKSKTIRLLTGALSLCVMLGAAFVGVYPAQAKEPDSPNSKAVKNEQGDLSQIEKYYGAGSFPLFAIAFSRLDENAQRTWLEKLYTANDPAFFSVAVSGLNTNSSPFTDFSEKAYEEGETAFFSILTDYMDESKLDSWLDRALKDEKWNFQSILFDKLRRGDDFDALKDKREKELEEAREAEYKAAGVTMDGKNYYYQGQLVNIFLDIRANKSFYTLNMNPAGSVHVKIIRDRDDKIADVAYMTEDEVSRLLEGMTDDDDWDDEDWP